MRSHIVLSSPLLTGRFCLSIKTYIAQLLMKMVIIFINIWFQFTPYRVDTVLGSDRVIVMSDGKAIEIGHPNILLQDPNSEFSKHVAANWVATQTYQEIGEDEFPWYHVTKDLPFHYKCIYFKRHSLISDETCCIFENKYSLFLA